MYFINVIANIFCYKFIYFILIESLFLIKKKQSKIFTIKLNLKAKVNRDFRAAKVCEKT